MSESRTRKAIKFGVMTAVALSGLGLQVKINKQQGFDIAKNQSTTITKMTVGVSEANAMCGAGLGCGGGGGMCGAGLGCSGGGGMCGAGLGCAGG